jgi:arylsulfatase
VTGADTGAPVMLAEDYKPPFAFTGTIKKALVDISGEVTEDLEAKVKMYLARQ